VVDEYLIRFQDRTLSYLAKLGIPAREIPERIETKRRFWSRQCGKGERWI
jgi:hypothetical protein